MNPDFKWSSRGGATMMSQRNIDLNKAANESQSVFNTDSFSDKHKIKNPFNK